MSFFLKRSEGGWKGWAIGLLSSYFFWVLGIMGLWGFVSNVFLGGYIAKQMGWLQSPFQYEVGIANLIFFILGFCCFFKASRSFQLASLVAFLVWREGSVIADFIRIYIKDSSSVTTLGPYFYINLLLPLLGLFIFWISKPKYEGSHSHRDHYEKPQDHQDHENIDQ
jgi:hypothetical protein